MPNRYKRDELLKIALDMAQIPQLDAHDIPDGVIAQDAYCVQWLQDMLDYWHMMFPYSTTVTSAALNIPALADKIDLPSDFIIDVRNGYLVQRVASDAATKRRCYRLPLQKFITRQLLNQKTTQVVPSFYCINGITSSNKQQMLVTPTPSVSVSGLLWYYALPPPLQSGDIPNAVSDSVLIEYIRIRAGEWARFHEPGTAQRFCERIISAMKSAGLLNQPEDDQIVLDELEYRDDSSGDMYSWMGER